MNLEKYEGTAIDTSVLEEVQSPAEPETEVVAETVEPVDEGNATETIETVESEVIETTDESNTPTEFDIPGVGKLTVEEIKEMKQGSLRQSDYTRKTQELARQRKELEDAANFFNYIKQNPHLVEALKQAEQNPNSIVHRASPEAERIDQIAYNLKAMEVDMKLNELKAKYGDVDEVALFTKANELNTDDLEFVYKGLLYESKPIDVDSIIKQAKEEAKAELKAELEKNREMVATTVDTRQQKPIESVTPLSPEEKRVAEAMGMTEDEYRKWL